MHDLFNEGLIEYINMELEEFIKHFNYSRDRFIENIKETPKISNERTIANFVGERLKSFFQKHYKTFYASEYYIKISGDSAAKKEQLKNKVDLTEVKHKWEYCTVDNYFFLENSNNSFQKHIFIEYKMQNSFEYASLASDYLKYKIFTAKNNLNTIFVYIIFDKKDDPSIENKNIINLNETINKNSIDKGNFYIYYPTENDVNVIDNNDSYFDKLKMLHEEIEALCKRIEVSENRKFTFYTDEENILLNNLNKFNSNIIQAEIIQNNYKYICDLWEKVEKDKKFDEHFKVFNFNDEKKINEFEGKVNHFVRYFINFQNNYFGKKKDDYSKDGYNVHHFSSFNIIVLFEVFANINEIKIEQPIYPTKWSHNTKSRSIDFNQTAKEKVEELSKIYQSELRNNLNGLALMYLQYIFKVYPLLFKIVNKKVTKKKEDYIIHKSVKKINKQLDKLKMKIEFDLNIDNYDVNAFFERVLINFIIKLNKNDNKIKKQTKD